MATAAPSSSTTIPASAISSPSPPPIRSISARSPAATTGTTGRSMAAGSRAIRTYRSPTWRRGWRPTSDYDYDVVPYYVERHYDYPRFVCYDCHAYASYSEWDPYRSVVHAFPGGRSGRSAVLPVPLWGRKECRARPVASPRSPLRLPRCGARQRLRNPGDRAVREGVAETSATRIGDGPAMMSAAKGRSRLPAYPPFGVQAEPRLRPSCRRRVRSSRSDGGRSNAVSRSSAGVIGTTATRPFRTASNPHQRPRAPESPS